METRARTGAFKSLVDNGTYQNTPTTLASYRTRRWNPAESVPQGVKKAVSRAIPSISSNAILGGIALPTSDSASLERRLLFFPESPTSYLAT